ncbi:MAG: hypothetical protein OES46_00095 [Gammaproteobacteria bacterium]|nr:hypothetical protein [Gammaproteobacteria bacterium]
MKSSMKMSLAAMLLTPTLILSFCVGIAAAGPPSLDELRRNHAAYQSWKQRNDSDIPFFLETTKLEKSTFVARMGVEMAGRSLAELATILGEPAAWCGFMPLHLNVKACVSVANGSDRREITLYLGRKHYQPPKKAKPLTLHFNSKHTQDLLSVNLYSKKGPYGTFHYHIDLYAIPTTGGVYSELRVSQRFGKVARRLGKLYLATLGRHKEGFTVSRYDRDGEPQYVRGIQGVVERNVVRYLLAIRVFLESQTLTGKEAFERRAELWFDETEAYKRQLHELPREEYLDNVRREYDNQVALQQSL